MTATLSRLARRCLRSLCAEPCRSAMGMALRLRPKSFMAACQVALWDLEHAGLVRMNARGEYVPTTAGRRLAGGAQK